MIKILQNVATNDVLSKYSLRGKKTKRVFEESYMRRLIIDGQGFVTTVKCVIRILGSVTEM